MTEWIELPNWDEGDIIKGSEFRAADQDYALWLLKRGPTPNDPHQDDRGYVFLSFLVMKRDGDEYTSTPYAADFRLTSKEFGPPESPRLRRADLDSLVDLCRSSISRRLRGL